MTHLTPSQAPGRSAQAWRGSQASRRGHRVWGAQVTPCTSISLWHSKGGTVGFTVLPWARDGLPVGPLLGPLAHLGEL